MEEHMRRKRPESHDTLLMGGAPTFGCVLEAFGPAGLAGRRAPLRDLGLARRAALRLTLLSCCSFFTSVVAEGARALRTL